MKTSLHLLRTAAMGLTSAAVLTLSSCTPGQQQGAGIGALGGGALGAIFGDDSDDVVRGAAIGAAAGAGAAAIKESNDRKAGNYNSGGDQPAPKPKKTSKYPLATPIAGTTSQVISPYKPHNVIDVKGFRTGQLARDPSTAPIGPDGKPDISKAKIFEMP
jgi:hypothetical protein